MKMKGTILTVTIVLIIAALTGACGYYAGSRHNKNFQKNIQDTEEYNDRRIAVVNMDEGISQGDDTVQYAAKLLAYSGADYTVTGLQDARNGTDTGLYSAYVVIPADFSEKVYSLNTQPDIMIGKNIWKNLRKNWTRRSMP